MSGLFGIFNTANSGLRAAQTSLQTTSHNISNANTEGYSRQRVTTAANVPQNLAGIGQLGTGTVISGVTRITDDYVNMQLQNEEASLTRYEQYTEVLGQLETMFNEPSETGISQQMTELFNTWNNLANNPESLTSKTAVVQQSETFLDAVNHTLTQMSDLKDETLSQIDKQVLDFNSAATQLKDLNDQIFNATVKGETPNDLLDRRDELVGDLKNTAGATVEFDKYDRAFVKLDGKDIVTENELTALQADATSGEISLESGEVVTVKTGAIKGLQEAVTKVDDTLNDMSGFVNDLADEVNTIYSNVSGDNFFEKTGDRIGVNQKLIDDSSFVVTGNSSAAGDGTLAKEIFNLQNKADGEGNTVFEKYNGIVTGMGIAKQQADNMVANQSDLTSMLAQRRESISGVDINEEVVNMIQFQSSYQANARVISTVSEMLDTLINRMGV